MLKPTGRDNYTTTPIIFPEFPEFVELNDGSLFDTRKALPITRAILMAGILALKKIPGGASRTAYSLERACFHLRRVKVKPRARAKAEPEDPDTIAAATDVVKRYLDYLRDNPARRHGLKPATLRKFHETIEHIRSARKLQLSYEERAKDLEW